MKTDPYLLLNIDEHVDDAQVQAAYHRQVRLHPPEHSPERFSAISEAYEILRTERDRICYRLFGRCPPADKLDEWVHDVAPGVPRQPMDAWLNRSRRAWLAERLEDLP